MAKKDFTKQVIPNIPQDEKILKEGMMQTMSLYGSKHRYAFRYAITEKGIWTLSRKAFFIKQKTTFLPYTDLQSYKLTKYGHKDCLIFYPKTGKVGSRVFFDDFESVVKLLDMYLPRTTEE